MKYPFLIFLAMFTQTMCVAQNSFMPKKHNLSVENLPENRYFKMHTKYSSGLINNSFTYVTTLYDSLQNPLVSRKSHRDSLKKEIIYCVIDRLKDSPDDDSISKYDAIALELLEQLEDSAKQHGKYKNKPTSMASFSRRNWAPIMATYKEQKRNYNSLYHQLAVPFQTFTLLVDDPTKTKIFYENVYGETTGSSKLNLVNSTFFTIGNNTGSVYVETVSDNFGPVRVRLGNMITASSADSSALETKQQAIQKLQSNGGNVVLSFELPLFWIHSRDQNFNLACSGVFGGAADFPQFGTSTTEYAGNIFAGLATAVAYQGDDKKLGLIADFSILRHDGNDMYKDNLQIDNIFWYSQASIGIMVNNTFKLSFVLPNLSNIAAFNTTKTSVGGQLMNSN